MRCYSPGGVCILFTTLLTCCCSLVIIICNQILLFLLNYIYYWINIYTKTNLLYLFKFKFTCSKTSGSATTSPILLKRVLGVTHALWTFCNFHLPPLPPVGLVHTTTSSVFCQGIPHRYGWTLPMVPPGTPGYIPRVPPGCHIIGLDTLHGATLFTDISYMPVGLILCAEDTCLCL